MNTQSEQLDQLDEVDEPVLDPDDQLDDDADFAPKPKQGLGKLTVALLIGIGLVAAFGGGAYVQKHHGGTTTNAPSFAGGRAGGTGGEGFPGGFGAAPGGTTTGSGTGTGSTTSGSGSTSTSASPAVIGTVVSVSGRTVTVKNFAGKTVKVTVPDDVTVTKNSTLTLADLAKGASVTVTGTTGTDGSVTATGVTAR